MLYKKKSYYWWCKKVTRWHTWLAWHPVIIGINEDGSYKKVWFERVKRKYVYPLYGFNRSPWMYKKYKDEEKIIGLRLGSIRLELRGKKRKENDPFLVAIKNLRDAIDNFKKAVMEQIVKDIAKIKSSICKGK